MKELIDKSAVIAEIEKRMKKYATIDVGNSSELDALYGAKCKALMEILSYLDTIETKEVDLEQEIKDYFDSQPIITRSKGVDYRLIPTGVDIAKHFYELGLKAQKG